MLRTDQLDYSLPQDRIATRPAQPRDSAGLLVVKRSDPGDIVHAHIRDLPELLRAGDLLVRNTSAVLEARLLGHRADTRGTVSGLFLESLEPTRWRCLFKSNSKLRPGRVIELEDGSNNPSDVSLTLDTRLDDGSWIVDVVGSDRQSVRTTLDRVGRTPVPPYILAARNRQGIEEPDANDRAWYHTVFEDLDTLDARGGSVAAPTAGLHLTEDLLDTLQSRSVGTADIVLHIGQGTFKPIETDTLEHHPMHAERFCVPVQTAEIIRQTQHAGGRVIALGTTAARALESIDDDHAAGHWHETRLLIAPGYEFGSIDGLLTNFHLPRSTLLAMVAALFSNGLDDLLPIYRVAIDQRYRFYSYGDAMLILP